MNPCARFFTRSVSFLCIGVFLFFVVACGEDDTQTQTRSNTAIAVRTQRVQAEDFQESAEGIGSLESPESVQIKPEISARLEEVHFQEGQLIEKGDLLFSLDAAKLKSELAADRAALESARASLDDARSTYRRFKNLFESRTISEQEFDTRQTALKTAQAEVERMKSQVSLARERLDDTTIRAPMSGALSERHADPGDYVEAGQTLVTLYTLDPLEISFRVAEAFMGRVEPGQRVMVRLASGEIDPCVGEVIFVGPSVDPQTRKFLVKASVCNPDGKLKPGAFARAEIILNVREDRPAVPEAALVSQRTGYSVFAVTNSTAVRRNVEIGLRKPGLAEIVEGVSVGEEIVVEGQMRLSDGAKVQVQDSPQQNATKPDDS